MWHWARSRDAQKYGEMSIALIYAKTGQWKRIADFPDINFLTMREFVSS